MPKAHRTPAQVAASRRNIALARKMKRGSKASKSTAVGGALWARKEDKGSDAPMTKRQKKTTKAASTFDKRMTARAGRKQRRKASRTAK